LGESVAAKSCIILNEDDIMLRYDDRMKILHADARNPLVVENRYLGYRITIDIKYFQVEITYSNAVPPSSSAVGSSITSVLSNNSVATPSSFSYKISSFFEDLSPNSILFENRRNQIYERSREYFWLSFVRDSLVNERSIGYFRGSFIRSSLMESGFKVYNKSKEIIYPEDYFIVIDDPIQQAKVVLIKPDTDIDRRQNIASERNIYGVMGIRAQNRIDSEVIFLTNRFFVDHAGNISTNDLVYMGDMSHQRVGVMLPRDFIYNPFNGSTAP